MYINVPKIEIIMKEVLNTISVFEGKDIRRTWHNNEWWFVIEDIVEILTDSKDPKQYIQKMKQRDDLLAQGWVQIVHTLPCLRNKKEL